MFSQISLSQKRTLALTVTMFAVGLTAIAVERVRNQLGDESTLTGFTLLASTAGLYLLTWRKKRAASRLGNLAMWLQIHVYMGTFASVVFLMHIGWPIRGWFESALAAVFVVVAVSGGVLGVMSRSTPRRLAAISRDFRVEQIPALQSSIAADAHRLALASAEIGEGATLAEYYQRRLLPFFAAPRGWLYRLLPTGGLRRQLERELADLDRYLAESSLAQRAELAQLLRAKDDLDYHAALQTRLRFLYHCHVALTWSLGLLIAVHVILVWRFAGAM